MGKNPGELSGSILTWSFVGVERVTIQKSHCCPVKESSKFSAYFLALRLRCPCPKKNISPAAFRFCRPFFPGRRNESPHNKHLNINRSEAYSDGVIYRGNGSCSNAFIGRWMRQTLAADLCCRCVDVCSAMHAGSISLPSTIAKHKAVVNSAAYSSPLTKVSRPKPADLRKNDFPPLAPTTPLVISLTLSTVKPSAKVRKHTHENNRGPDGQTNGKASTSQTRPHVNAEETKRQRTMYVSGSKMVGCCTSLLGNTPQDKAVVPLIPLDRVLPLTSTWLVHSFM